jgi:type I restriction enzyme R subunit
VKNEKLTRKEIIDYRLKQAGWNVDDRTQVVEEFDITVDPKMAQEAATPYAGKQFSDYVLLAKDGKLLAVVEAKKSTVDGNKPNNIATISNKHNALTCLFAFIPTDTTFTFGT